jgi:hypothetical protein
MWNWTFPLRSQGVSRFRKAERQIGRKEGRDFYKEGRNGEGEAREQELKIENCEVKI